ncbi:hypothetical protein WS71_06195 [Burkholderia mayonis]|uniref:Uncharacterized protein n=1 Tax=Burkholderia mayonis TaxID=1385591 RepID=A0A1B4FTF8_9BURK|nr:hypothetical protein WS71_06195 [Burkholderia mayonis]KVE58979.1 hypothetical protein WS71_00915 [Burkholderia mayonis]
MSRIARTDFVRYAMRGFAACVAYDACGANRFTDVFRSALESIAWANATRRAAITPATPARNRKPHRAPASSTPAAPQRAFPLQIER